MSTDRVFPGSIGAPRLIAAFLLTLTLARSAQGWPNRWQHAEVPLPLEWYYHLGDVEGAAAADYFDAHWPQIMVPNTLQPALRPNNAEVAWYRLHMPIGRRYAGKRLILELGRVTGSTRVFVNGAELDVVTNTTPAAFYIEHMKMGEDYGLSRKDDIPQRVFLPPAVLRFGAMNTFAVRVQAGDERGPNIIGPLQVRCQSIDDLLEFREFAALDTDPLTQMGGISLFFRRPYWVKDAAAVERDWPLHVTVTDYFGVQVAAKDIVVPMSHLGQWRDTIPFKVECDQMYRLTFYYKDTDEQLRYYVWCSKLGGQRQRLSLDGTWDIQTLAEKPDSLPAADAEWDSIRVPMSWHWAAEPYGQQTDLKHCAWLRRSFTVPTSMHGKRLELNFANIKATGRVYLNGEPIAYHQDGWVPLRLDVTDRVDLDKPNEILVAVTDQSALLAPGVALPSSTFTDTRQESYRGVAQYALRYTEMGLPGSVDLSAHPAVFVRDVFVQSQVSNGTLEATAVVRNDSTAIASVDAGFQILRNGARIDALEPGQVTLEPGSESPVVGRGKVDLETWSVNKPILYQLRLTLTAGPEVLDVLDTRFGYREVTIDKDRFLLNGNHYNLRRTSFGGGFEMGPSAIDRVFARHLDSGINLLRTHNFGYRGWWFDIADELGLPLQLEGAWFGYKQAIADRVFWDNIRFHAASLATYYRNHPSLALCTLGNEVQHNTIKAEDRAGLISLWRQQAPHVPVGFDDDYGYDDGKDFTCIHYPYPVFMHLLWPDSAYWLQTPAPLKIDRPPGVMQWRGERPLIVGELFGPPYANAPDGVSVLGGDEVYSTRDSAWPWWLKGQKMLIDGQRLSGGAGSDPWHFQQSDSWMNASLRPPIAAIMREWDRRFYSEQTVQRTLSVLNDTLAPAAVELQWALRTQTGIEAQDAKQLLLEPGRRSDQIVSVRMPQVRQRTTAVFDWSLHANGEVISSDQIQVQVFPREVIAVTDGISVVLYDPTGQTAQGLVAVNLDLPRLDAINPDTLDNGIDLLIIGENAAAAGDIDAAALGSWLEAGGCVFVMRQESKLVPVPLKLDFDPEYEVNNAFVSSPSHPLLTGLTNDDFHYWRGREQEYPPFRGPEPLTRAQPTWPPDHRVCRGVFTKPARGNFTVLLESGGREGTQFTPLIEIPVGTGRAVLSQLRFSQNYGREPAVDRLLQNVLAWPAAAPRTATSPLYALKSTDSGSLRALELAGALVEKVDGLDALGDRRTLMLSAAGELSDTQLAMLKDWVAGGGTLWLRRLTPDNIAGLAGLLPPGLTVRHSPAAQMALMHKTGIASGLSNHDLFWRAGRKYHYWSTLKPVLDIVEHSLADTDTDSWTVFTKPGALASSRLGAGRVVVDQLNWAEAAQADPARASRLLATLITNMQCTADGTVARKVTPLGFVPLDLGRFYNRTLKAETATPELGAFVHGKDSTNDLREFPLGDQVFNGVPFHIQDGCIALHSATHAPLFPQTVEGIAVGSKVSALYFLHLTAWGGSGKEWEYVVRYIDGRKQHIRVVGSVNSNNWHMPKDLPGARLAWQGSNPVRAQIGAWLLEWPNPEPDLPVDTIAIVSAATDAVPVILGITAGKPTLRIDDDFNTPLQYLIRKNKNRAYIPRHWNCVEWTQSYQDTHDNAGWCLGRIGDKQYHLDSVNSPRDVWVWRDVPAVHDAFKLTFKVHGNNATPNAIAECRVSDGNDSGYAIQLNFGVDRGLTGILRYDAGKEADDYRAAGEENMMLPAFANGQEPFMITWTRDADGSMSLVVNGRLVLTAADQTHRQFSRISFRTCTGRFWIDDFAFQGLEAD